MQNFEKIRFYFRTVRQLKWKHAQDTVFLFSAKCLLWRTSSTALWSSFFTWKDILQLKFIKRWSKSMLKNALITVQWRNGWESSNLALFRWWMTKWRVVWGQIWHILLSRTFEGQGQMGEMCYLPWWLWRKVNVSVLNIKSLGLFYHCHATNLLNAPRTLKTSLFEWKMVRPIAIWMFCKLRHRHSSY